jgi:SPP1 gp7 family putative phage head morphogenesis protein
MLQLAKVYQTEILEAAKQIIVQGIIDGKSNQGVMKDLGRLFPMFGKNRLENIARTGSSRIYNAGRATEMQGNNDIIGYEVTAILDARICPICKPLDGTVFAKDEIRGRVPPYHFMCRCALMPIFAWETSDLQQGTRWPTDHDVMKGFGGAELFQQAA